MSDGRQWRYRCQLSLPGLAVLVALLTGACSEDDKTGVLEPPTTISADVMLSTYAEFNYMSADITISSEGAYDGFNRPDSFRGQAYTVERYLQGNGVWATNMTLSRVEPFNAPPPPDVRFIDIARVETDDAGSFQRVYDRAGNLVSDPLPAERSSPVSGGDPYIPPGQSPYPELDPLPAERPSPPPDCTDPSICPPAPTSRIPISDGPLQSPSMTIASPRPGAPSRNWLDHIIVTPLSSARTVERLRRQLGPKKDRVGVLDRYSRQINGRLREVLVDPISGAIVEENYAVNGELQAQIRHEYVPVGSTVLALRKTRTEFLSDNKKKKTRSVFTTTFSNVKVEKRATP